MKGGDQIDPPLPPQEKLFWKSPALSGLKRDSPWIYSQQREIYLKLVLRVFPVKSRQRYASCHNVYQIINETQT